MAWWDMLAKVGGAVAAPFTGGASLAIPAALTGLSAVGGALGQRKGARTGEQSSTFDNTYTTTPNISPENASLADLTRSMITKRLSSPTPLAGYQAQGLGNINRTSDLVRQSIQNRLSSAGLGGSPIEGNALAQAELSRGGQVAGFLNQLPLLERELGGRDIEMASRFGALQPHGTTATGRGSSAGTFTAPGSALSGAFGDTASMLGWLAGMGMLGGGQKGGAGGAGDLLGGGGDLYGGIPGAGAGASSPFGSLLGPIGYMPWDKPPYRGLGG